MSDNEDNNIPSPEVCESRMKQFVMATDSNEALAIMMLQQNDWDLQKALNEHFNNQEEDVIEVDQEDNEDVIDISDDNEEVNAIESNADLTQDFKVRDFTSITQADEETAKNILSNQGWDLCRALDVYFNANSSGSSSKIMASTRAPENMSFLTWNIDGLDDKNLSPRIKAICSMIEQRKFNVVFLQEVISNTLDVIRNQLSNYQVLCNENDEYFTAILLRKFTIYLDSFENLPYESSVMGRGLSIAQCHIGKAKFVLMNTHLESTKDYSNQRKTQLKYCLDFMRKQNEDKTVIFAGDLNLRDKELSEIGSLPNEIDDLWIRMGSRKECQYTWDLTRNTNKEIGGRFKPRLRFDRVYIRDGNPLQSQCEYFGLFGIEKVPGTQSYPSDHWGLCANFKINSN